LRNRGIILNETTETARKPNETGKTLLINAIGSRTTRTGTVIESVGTGTQRFGSRTTKITV